VATPTEIRHSGFLPASNRPVRFDGSANAFCDVAALCRTGLGQDRDDLLAAIPGDEVDVAQSLLHDLGDVAQDLISERVSVLVVHPA